MKQFRLFGLVFLLCNVGSSYVVLRSDSGPVFPELRYRRVTPVCTLSYKMNQNEPNPACSLRIKEAAQAWQNDPRSELCYQYTGETNINSVLKDSINIFCFNDKGNNNILATCYYWYWRSSGYLTQFDVEVNTYYSWCYTGLPGPSQYDFQAVMAHEFGHSFGLGDLYDTVPGVADTLKTMFGHSHFGEYRKRTLEQDDKDGVAHLYPKDSLDRVWICCAPDHDASPYPTNQRFWESPDILLKPDPPVLNQPCTAYVTVRNVWNSNVYARLYFSVYDANVGPMNQRTLRYSASQANRLIPPGNRDIDRNGSSDYANAQGDGETTYTFVWTPTLNRFGQNHHTVRAYVSSAPDSGRMYVLGGNIWPDNNAAWRSLVTTNNARANLPETLRVEGGSCVAGCTLTRRLRIYSDSLPVGWTARIEPAADTLKTLYPSDTLMPFQVIVTPSAAAQPGDSGKVRVTCSQSWNSGMFWFSYNGGITWKVKVSGPGDVGATAILSPTGTINESTVVTPSARVKNHGDRAESFAVRFRIGAAYSHDTTVMNLGAGDSAIVNFANWTALTGSYTVSCSTMLAADGNRTNDKRTGALTVQPRPAHDVSCLRIVEPSGTLLQGTVVIPRAVVRNLGNANESFPVRFRIGSVYSQDATVSNLSVNESVFVTFPSWTAVVGDHPTSCSTMLAADGNRTNDKSTGAVSVVSGGVSGWIRKADMPAGPKGKNVKDGGCLTHVDTGYVYAAKGNNRCEFYCYNTVTNVWTTLESIPAIGRSGKKKLVKKGACITESEGKVYLAKGNNSLELWEYNPASGSWTQKTDIPVGARTVRQGAGMTSVTLDGTPYVYVLKGSGTTEFYRFNPTANYWETMTNAPLGATGKTFKNGSCLATDGSGTIYALKGSYNELFAYDAAVNLWTTKAILPFIGRAGVKKKVKDGAGLAWLDGRLYALKGGNTREFWSYDPLTDKWTQSDDLLLGNGKDVRGGGALTAANDVIYALKGNNTLEFYQYVPVDAQTAVQCRLTATQETVTGLLLPTLGIRTPITSGAITLNCAALPVEIGSQVRLTVLNSLGQVVYSALTTHGLFNIGHLPAGVYVVRLERTDQRVEGKLVVLN